MITDFLLLKYISFRFILRGYITEKGLPSLPRLKINVNYRMRNMDYKNESVTANTV